MQINEEIRARAREKLQALEKQVEERFGGISAGHRTMLEGIGFLLEIRLGCQERLKDGLTETFYNGKQKFPREKREYAELLKAETQITKMLRAMNLIGGKKTEEAEEEEDEGALEY